MALNMDWLEHVPMVESDLLPALWKELIEEIDKISGNSNNQRLFFEEITVPEWKTKIAITINGNIERGIFIIDVSNTSLNTYPNASWSWPKPTKDSERYVLSIPVSEQLKLNEILSQISTTEILVNCIPRVLSGSRQPQPAFPIAISFRQNNTYLRTNYNQETTDIELPLFYGQKVIITGPSIPVTQEDNSDDVPTD